MLSKSFLQMPPKRRHMASTSNTIVPCRSHRSRRSSLLEEIPALPFYYDCGNCTCVCEYCGGFFDIMREYCIYPEPIIHDIRNVVSQKDYSINKGCAPYVFKVSGQIYHWIGSFYPQDVHQPRFLQLYTCDTENEVANRLHSFHGEGEVLLSADVVDSLSHMLHTHNEYVRTFKTAKEIAQSMNLDSYGVRLFSVVPDRRYGPPATGSLGCIVCGDNVSGVVFDIVVYSKSGSPQRVSKLHPTYMPLQYPLLFPYGEEGWSPTLHLQYISGVYDALSKGDTDSRFIEKRVFLPTTFIGGPRMLLPFARFMVSHNISAPSLAMLNGRRYMDAIGQHDIQNRPNIIVHIFKIKVHAFINFHKEDKTFGDVSACKGLPHCHTLLWVTSSFRIQEGADIDKYITAELPDPILEPALYMTITTCMLHGPCGSLNIGAPCMVDDRCVKRFPKPFNPLTIFDENGYVHYRRRAGSYHVLQSGVITDNNYVVPYNKRLCSRFDAHINVEYCGWNMMINTFQKGLITFVLLFKHQKKILPLLPIHERDPHVQVLVVHLEGMQPTIFKENSQLGSLIDTPGFGVTTLTEWLHNNQHDVRGIHLTYNDYPSKYICDTKDKRWIHRTTTTNTTIGKLACVHPTAGETVRENTYSTFRDACEALELTGDDKEWLTTFEEASSWATSSELRSLFYHLLFRKLFLLWEAAKPKMGDEIAHTFTSNSTDPNEILRVDTLEQQILLEIQKTLLASTPSKSLTDFGLPMPSPSLLSILRNRLLLEETNYDTNLLISQNSSMVSQLNPYQLTIYERVVDDERNKKQLLLFEKLFLWTTILSYFRSRGKIILVVAALGVASLLLPSGRIVHSRFVILIDFTDKSSWNIKKNTQLAELLKGNSMIIWDEAPKSDRHVLEDDNHLFGGMPMLLGGDFRETLHVQPKSRKSQIISLTLPNSYLYSHFTVFKLHHNMCLSQPFNSNTDVNQISQFASWLLDIGNGNVGTPYKNDPESTNSIQIPHCFLIELGDKGLDSLIHFVYGKDIFSNPLLEDQGVVYNSCDSIKSQTHDSLELDTLYPQDYLSNLHFSGFPSHTLILKVNTLVMQMRNINQREGLCNGTRLIVTQLLPSVIEASIITGISMCYAMTINKSQGQSLKKVGLYLTNSVFTHEQLYAALSRATSPDSIKILLQQEVALPFNYTRNVVFEDLAISSNMDRISNLQFGSPGNSLEIHVLRKWTLQFRKDETWFIVIDEHGDTIQLLAQKTNQRCIETSLVVSRCYRIKDYTCTELDKYQKVLNHPVHMNIGEASTIEEIPNHSVIPLTWFRFGPRSHFQIIADKNLEHPDFIGVLIDMKDHTRKKNKEPFMCGGDYHTLMEGMHRFAKQIQLKCPYIKL
uniref:ATP-dependent DNA helicase n=1 Tax=Lactuca sativa TaxID=4236 RepID=A0A9R1VMY6_LACSA|nr:hypothetical protein LSAT_V11C500278750 [Lactuca sativa]